MFRQTHRFNTFGFVLSTECEDIMEEIRLMFSALHCDACEGPEWTIKREPRKRNPGGGNTNDPEIGPRFSLYKDRRLVQTGDAGKVLEAAEWGVTMTLLKNSNIFLQIHSSVVAKDGKALLLIGDPGSGKSTLALAMLLEGWLCLSDEIALIEAVNLSEETTAMRDPTRRVFHFPRCFHVDDRTLSMIGGVSDKGACGKLRDISGKLRLDPAHLKSDWTIERAEPVRLVFLDKEMDVENSLVPISKTESFAKLVKNAINLCDYGDEGIQHLAALVNGCSCCKFKGGTIESAVRSISNFF